MSNHFGFDVFLICVLLVLAKSTMSEKCVRLRGYQPYMFIPHSVHFTLTTIVRVVGAWIKTSQYQDCPPSFGKTFWLRKKNK